MASQKETKSRIASVKNIQKITRAMEMVSAARLRRAEQRIEQLRPYADGIRKMTRRASEAAREWFAENRYQDYLYLHGLSVEMAEAFAEYVHKRIRGELGFAAEEARDHDEMLNQGYRGSRYSFGYPACPNLADQKQLLDLLRADEIGIALSEEDQLDPEQSTSAIVVHHPQAKYFSV